MANPMVFSELKETITTEIFMPKPREMNVPIEGEALSVKVAVSSCPACVFSLAGGRMSL